MYGTDNVARVTFSSNVMSTVSLVATHSFVYPTARYEDDPWPFFRILLLPRIGANDEHVNEYKSTLTLTVV